jgi:hypothetical protein
LELNTKESFVTQLLTSLKRVLSMAQSFEAYFWEKDPSGGIFKHPKSEDNEVHKLSKVLQKIKDELTKAGIENYQVELKGYIEVGVSGLAKSGFEATITISGTTQEKR